ncbi:hypothetical protein PV755_00535 [Streptomyces caniscabiei]|uniref:hypothetical protein n=1 Tax=Streptomyces caniscabiei TaxID=2746961 RepID=UPI0029AF729F|nr:hypothetical protein [Streptomyces caniscabiei]MDX3507420.1 hypothetical protein [Streptomyces caniscabiei]
MSTRNLLTADQRAKIAELIGDARPATSALLVSFGESVRDRRDHEHPQWEDIYCLNLSSYMGERMAPVLRRLIDAESRAERYRIAWGMARTRAISTGGAADRYADRAREGQEALQHMLFAVIAAQLARKAATDETAELRARVAEVEAAESHEEVRPDTTESQPLTVFRAEHDSIVMGLYTTAAEARKHCEDEERRSWPNGTDLSFDWIEDEDDGVAELVVVAGQNEESTTGYVVAALEAASKYDPDGEG